MLHEIGLSLSIVGILNLPFSFFLFPLVSIIIVNQDVIIDYLYVLYNYYYYCCCCCCCCSQFERLMGSINTFQFCALLQIFLAILLPSLHYFEGVPFVRLHSCFALLYTHALEWPFAISIKSYLHVISDSLTQHNIVVALPDNHIVARAIV